MENENQVKNEEVKNECKHPMHHKMHMIAIILSIVAIVFSSFSLGFTISTNRKQDRHDNRFTMQDGRMGMMGMPGMNNRFNKPSNENYTPEFDRPAKESKGPSEQQKN